MKKQTKIIEREKRNIYKIHMKTKNFVKPTVKDKTEQLQREKLTDWKPSNDCGATRRRNTLKKMFFTTIYKIFTKKRNCYNVFSSNKSQSVSCVENITRRRIIFYAIARNCNSWILLYIWLRLKRQWLNKSQSYRQNKRKQNQQSQAADGQRKPGSYSNRSTVFCNGNQELELPKERHEATAEWWTTTP